MNKSCKDQRKHRQKTQLLAGRMDLWCYPFFGTLKLRRNQDARRRHELQFGFPSCEPLQGFVEVMSRQLNGVWRQLELLAHLQPCDDLALLCWLCSRSVCCLLDENCAAGALTSHIQSTTTVR